MFISISLTVPPRNVDLAIKKRSQDVRVILDCQKYLKFILNDLDREDERIFSEREFYRDYQYENGIDITDLFGRFYSYLKEMMLEHTIVLNGQENAENLEKYINSDLMHVKLNNDFRFLNKKLPPIQELEEYDEEPDLQRVYQIYMTGIRKIEAAWKALKRLVFFKKQMKAFAEQREAIQKREYDGDRNVIPRSTKKVEKVYHATATLSYLRKHGFSEKPVNHRGLGEIGSTRNTISVTYDLNVAREIARALKEVWLIVHKKITEEQIKDWYKKSNAELPSVLEKKDSEENLLALYNRWLWTNKSEYRSNPVFGDIQKFGRYAKKIRYEDIGILELLVSTKDADWQPAESEFRVKPQNILKIKRMIR